MAFEFFSRALTYLKHSLRHPVLLLYISKLYI